MTENQYVIGFAWFSLNKSRLTFGFLHISNYRVSVFCLTSG